MSIKPEEAISSQKGQAIVAHVNTACVVCGSLDLAQVVDLPQFPLTGIYVAPNSTEHFPTIDQAFLLCQSCGHGQLKNIVAPDFLYGRLYDHRSSKSPIATRGNDFFFKFLEQVAPGRKYHTVVEVGCNDLYLLQKISDRAERLVGIDPIWIGRETEVPQGKISVIGGLIENVDLRSSLSKGIDLVVSVHCFEHMANPKPQLERLLQAAEDGALFVVEVPGFDSLLNNNRFDQVFHQHIQYFSVASFLRMLNEVGGTYLAHTFNYDYWGGTMLVAFRKTAKLPQYSLPKSVRPPTTVVVEKSYENFQQQIMNLMASLESLRSEAIYGYGAAQMVPTLAYHMHSDLSFLTSILDDNPDRCGLTYPGLKVTIQPRKDELDLKDASVIVTALDSARPIMRRLLELRPRQILIPLNIL